MMARDIKVQLRNARELTYLIYLRKHLTRKHLKQKQIYYSINLLQNIKLSERGNVNSHL